MILRCSRKCSSCSSALVNGVFVEEKLTNDDKQCHLQNVRKVNKHSCFWNIVMGGVVSCYCWCCQCCFLIANVLPHPALLLTSLSHVATLVAPCPLCCVFIIASLLHIHVLEPTTTHHLLRKHHLVVALQKKGRLHDQRLGLCNGVKRMHKTNRSKQTCACDSMTCMIFASILQEWTCFKESTLAFQRFPVPFCNTLCTYNKAFPLQLFDDELTNKIFILKLNVL